MESKLVSKTYHFFSQGYIYLYFLAGIPKCLPSPPIPNKPFTHVGCWRDTRNRAVPTLEGKDKTLIGRYSSRANAIQLCFKAAVARRFKVFALQAGGWCAGSADARGYKKYGKANNCKAGKGGGWANDVYVIGKMSRCTFEYFSMSWIRGNEA